MLGGVDVRGRGFLPAVIMDTLATMGRLASMDRMKGVILVERTRDATLNNFRPRTVLR